MRPVSRFLCPDNRTRPRSQPLLVGGTVQMGTLEVGEAGNPDLGTGPTVVTPSAS